MGACPFHGWKKYNLSFWGERRRYYWLIITSITCLGANKSIFSVVLSFQRNETLMVENYLTTSIMRIGDETELQKHFQDLNDSNYFLRKIFSRFLFRNLSSFFLYVFFIYFFYIYLNIVKRVERISLNIH